MIFLASFMNLAGPGLIVILLIILVLFGAKKLPELARGMGQWNRKFCPILFADTPELAIKLCESFLLGVIRDCRQA